MERLDKVLANSGYGTRKEVKKLIKDGNIKINDKIIKSSNIQVDIDKDEILIKDKKLVYKKYIYLLMNKPSGVISATEDNYDKTVIDILNEYHKSFKPAPVGRLDKDTVGLLLITNDGELNHRMLAPKWHVDKVYYAVIDSIVNDEDILAFKEGITLDDGYKCKPGKLEIINTDEEVMKSSVKVTIHEGKFHQVKKMFLATGKKVMYLKRIAFGPLILTDDIKEGDYRELKEDEIKLLKTI